MFTSETEQLFFINHLNSDMNVLEYGSGQSTREIAQKVKSIISIEHQANWYNKLINDIPNNCNLILTPPNMEYTEGGHCGTYEQFKNYIESPIKYGPYDLILIDGRARVSCVSIVHKMAKENTIIFVHDYHREEYKECEKYLKLVDICETMAKFKV